MYLVFDIGGTKTRIGFSEDGESILEEKIIHTPHMFVDGMSQFREVVKNLIGDRKVKAVAGGIKGVLNKEKSMIVSHPAFLSIPDWVYKPIKLQIENILEAPVFLENDTCFGALGEAIRGSGKNFEIVVFISVSTGVGGARIVNKKIDEKSIGFEPGKQIITIDHHTRYLEDFISGEAIKDLYGKKGEEIDDDQVWNEITKRLGVGLNNTIVHWSPDVVVLGGSVGARIDLKFLENYLEQLLGVFPNIPAIVRSELGDSGGLFGALEYLKQKKA